MMIEELKRALVEVKGICLKNDVCHGCLFYDTTYGCPFEMALYPAFWAVDDWKEDSNADKS